MGDHLGNPAHNVRRHEWTFQLHSSTSYFAAIALALALSSHGRISPRADVTRPRDNYDIGRAIPFWRPCEGNPSELCIFSFQFFAVVNKNTASKIGAIAEWICISVIPCPCLQTAFLIIKLCSSFSSFKIYRPLLHSKISFVPDCGRTIEIGGRSGWVQRPLTPCTLFRKFLMTCSIVLQITSAGFE